MSRNNIIALNNDKPARTKNKISVGIEPYFPPQNPAKIFPKKLVKNHVPIRTETNCFGASFDTRDSPIGDIQSSATVIMKYTPTSQNIETFPASEKSPASAIIT